MHPTPQSLNETVKDRLVNIGSRITPIQNTWTDEFAKLPVPIVKKAFGLNGELLHIFLSVMDVDHLDLERCLEEKLFHTHDHPAELFKSIVGLIRLALDQGKEHLLNSLYFIKLLPENLPIVVKSFVRCLQDSEQRESIRRTKRPQVIDMSTVAKKGEELWNTQPSCFDSLIRFENAYASEILAAKKRAARFLGLGCSAMHAEVMKTVETFQSQIADSFVGFNRLTFNRLA